MDTENVVNIHNGMLLGHKKKNEILALAAKWTELEGIMLNEMSQTQKEKYHRFSLTHGS